jgi:predicted dehydrogenase
VKVVIVGCGSIGRRHAKNLLSLGHAVAAVDINNEYRKWVEENLKVKTYDNFEAAIRTEEPIAAFVCTPPSNHIVIAQQAVDVGLHVFIEKPLSHSLQGIDQLVQKARKKDLKIAVGYNLRFSKGIMKLKELLGSGTIGKPLYARIIARQYLPDWRPWQNYKSSYTAKKSLGGGIILDGSHEIDYARWLLGDVSKVTCVAKKISSLEVETEDTADIIYEFKNGAVANIHLDFVRRDYKRVCELVGEKGSLEFIFGESVTWIDGETKERKIFDVREDHNETYMRETNDFLEAIEKKREPLVTAEEGKKSLILALEAKKAAEEERTIVIE